MHFVAYIVGICAGLGVPVVEVNLPLVFRPIQNLFLIAFTIILVARSRNNIMLLTFSLVLTRIIIKDEKFKYTTPPVTEINATASRGQTPVKKNSS